MSWIPLALALAPLLLAHQLGHVLRVAAELASLRAKFAATLSGRCFFCSYHRFGRREFGIRQEIPPHDCVEGGPRQQLFA